MNKHIILILLICLAGCQKDNFSIEESLKKQQEEQLIQAAKKWYDVNSLSKGGDKDIDLALYAPDWSTSQITENFNGVDILNVQIRPKNDANNEIGYAEVSVMLYGDDNPYGVIKTYEGNPFVETTAFRMFRGTGEEIVTGEYYKPSLGIRKAKMSGGAGCSPNPGGSDPNRPQSGAGDGPCNDDGSDPTIDGGTIPEVIVPPPPGSNPGNPGTNIPFPSFPTGPGTVGGGTNPPQTGQTSKTDKEPTAYVWRDKLYKGFEGILKHVTPQFVEGPDGELISNSEAYNCHYHAIAEKDPAAITGTLEDMGMPKWVTDVNLKNWDKVSSDVKIGDIVIYNGVSSSRSGPIHGWKHSAVVTKVDSEGYAIEVSSKMGEYEVIKHHPRDIPPAYGDTGSTYTFEGKTYPSREYYRKK